ncbi:AraC family transcriptional regulator [Brasilonema sp. UFV-L1]
MEYINEHLNQDIKLADLAKLLGMMSQFHFRNLFKHPTNICCFLKLDQS